jgi:hypothetical protein
MSTSFFFSFYQANLTVVVTKNGTPVSDANVIVIEKAVPTIWHPIPSFYTGKTNGTGTIGFNLPDGKYLVMADDGGDYRAWADDVEVSSSSPVTLTLRLVEKHEVRYYVKLFLSVDVAQYLAPVVNALAQVSDKFLEVVGWFTSRLGINIPPVELAQHYDIEKVEGSGNVITIWFKYTGSPVAQAVIVLALVLAIVIVLSVIAPITIKWAFGEQAVTVMKLVAYAVIAVAVASTFGTIAYMLKR